MAALPARLLEEQALSNDESILIWEVSPLRQSSQKRVQFASFCSTVGKSSQLLASQSDSNLLLTRPSSLGGEAGDSQAQKPDSRGAQPLPERRQRGCASAPGTPVPGADQPRVPCREGLWLGPKAEHGAAQGQRKSQAPEKGARVGSPLHTQHHGCGGSRSGQGALREPRGCKSRGRGRVLEELQPLQGAFYPPGLPKPRDKVVLQWRVLALSRLSWHKHIPISRGARGGLFSTAAYWRCWGGRPQATLHALIPTCINIRCHLHPDECCRVQLPQFLRQGIPEGQSQWSRILPSPSHRHPAPI